MSNQEFKLPSPIEVAVLELLAGKEMYGLEMVKASGRLKRGTIYVTLDRMEDKGLVKSRVVDEKGLQAGRRIYSITGHGQRSLEAWRQVQATFALNAGFAQ